MWASGYFDFCWVFYEGVVWGVFDEFSVCDVEVFDWCCDVGFFDVEVYYELSYCFGFYSSVSKGL